MALQSSVDRPFAHTLMIKFWRDLGQRRSVNARPSLCSFRQRHAYTVHDACAPRRARQGRIRRRIRSPKIPHRVTIGKSGAPMILETIRLARRACQWLRDALRGEIAATAMMARSTASWCRFRL